MKSILELMFTSFWIAILISCSLVVIMFLVGFVKAIYIIYFMKKEIDQDFYNGKLN